MLLSRGRVLCLSRSLHTSLAHRTAAAAAAVEKSETEVTPVLRHIPRTSPSPRPAPRATVTPRPTSPLASAQSPITSPTMESPTTPTAHISFSEAGARTKGAHWVNDEGTQFTNPWPSARNHPPFSVISKFLWDGLWIPKPELADPSAFITTVTPDFTPPEEGVKATWLGHACVLVQFAPRGAERGLTVLFDPVFSRRCGPTQLFGAPKRFTPVPCGDVSGLPEIDIVAISHNHYDHLDLPTLAAIYARQKAPPALIAPLNTWRVLRGTVPAEVYREADWWESVTVAVGGRGTLKFTCTPAQHMTARTAWDTGRSLWGGWAVEEQAPEGAKVWFAGDTGYAAVDAETHDIDPAVPTCPAFKEIGERFGGFDLAFIPIGAYSPRRFLSTVHCAPIDAVRVFRDVRARKALPIHWGTWDLSHEQLSDPPRHLAEARKVLDISEEEFGVWELGGSRTVTAAVA